MLAVVRLANNQQKDMN